MELGVDVGCCNRVTLIKHKCIPATPYRPDLIGQRGQAYLAALLHKLCICAKASADPALCSPCDGVGERASDDE